MKKISFFSLFCMLSAFVFAQNPDFSGTWALNTEKSKLNPDFSMAPGEMIISQKGNDLTIEKHSSFQGESFTTVDKLTLDGKECLNTGFMDTQKKSTAGWSDDKTSLKVVSRLVMGDGGEMTITDIYKMDSNNLVYDSSSSSSFGDMAETMVFDKK